MQSPQLSVVPLADHLTVTHNDRSDKGIRAYPPASTLRKLKSPPQVFAIRACELGIHMTD
jgi:hypothetical protein